MSTIFSHLAAKNKNFFHSAVDDYLLSYFREEDLTVRGYPSALYYLQSHVVDRPPEADMPDTVELESRHTTSQNPFEPDHDGQYPSSNAVSYAPSRTSTTALSQPSDSSIPDGGRGWVVISACAVITWWFVGTTYSWGVIQGSLVAQGVSTPLTLSFVGSLTVAFIALLAIINAKVIRVIGAQYTAMTGISLLGLGEILSGFTTEHVGGMFATTGILMGIGTSLCFMAVSVVPAQYFLRKRGIANGIVYAGGGLGGAATSFAMDGLINRVGIPWTFRIIGFMTIATGLPAAWLVRDRAPSSRSKFVDWKLFGNLKFVLLFAAGAIATFPLFVPPFFLPLYSTSIGFSPSVGAWLVAGFNFSSAGGRIGFGYSCDVLGAFNSLFASLLLSALSMLALWPVSKDLGPLIAFIVINGAANGGFFATMPTVIGAAFGSTMVSLVMGMIVTGWAGGYLMGAPIAGYLLAAFGGQEGGLVAFRPAMYYAGSMALGAAVLVAFARFNIDRSLLKRV
jgi:MFS family permease